MIQYFFENRQIIILTVMEINRIKHFFRNKNFIKYNLYKYLIIIHNASY